MMTSSEIRQTFLDFFKSKQHEIVPSASIVIKNDPTLLFTNAGMNQFKNYFLGNQQPPYKRIADTQKCLRVSGKHNDLEEVGVDTYHHTMFEMLGNWSFGDYFKAEAIAWAWELLTEVYKIDKDKLYVTVFEGDAKEGLQKDDESYNEWKKWVAEDRILLGNKKDNFWEMGDTGPCGPSSEIHYDGRSEEERKNVDGKTLVNNDNPQVIEIWNIVFIQFNRLKNSSLEHLPQKHVDTGMGFERLVRVLQNKHSNYDTDVFTGTINEIEKITNKKYNYSDSKEDVAFRVLSDHIRAICFTIADGLLPFRDGAGYVIRRILRRAVRYYYSNLNYKQPLLFQLVDVIAKQFKDVFPELNQEKDFAKKVIKEEEEAFLRTIGNGLLKLNDEILVKKLIKQFNHDYVLKITGKFAFELQDSLGFPFDLIKLIATENEFKVDEVEYEKEMQAQRDRSKKSNEIVYYDWTSITNKGNKPINDFSTEEFPESTFIGFKYENNLNGEKQQDGYITSNQTYIKKYRPIKNKDKLLFQIVLNETPFYAEGGGQVGDTGEFIINDEKLKIIDTKKENNLTVHFAEALPTNIGNNLIAKVDITKRRQTAIHHTATHLLHAALRQVLGNHVQQKGSLVNAEHLRFDFSHFAKMTDEEIAKVEAMVNEKIRENIYVVIKQMPKEEAMKLGAMALFGEKYGDIVRVVMIDPHYSVELCGGTHVGATGELGFFKIKTETAVAAGVRRIEAVAGKAAEALIEQQFQQVDAIREALKNPKDILKSIENLSAENIELKKQIESFESKQLQSIKNELLQKIQTINGINFIGEKVEVSNADALKKLCFDLKTNFENYCITLVANIGGKASVAIMMDDKTAADKNLDASKIIRQNIAPLIKGGGGGQKTLATAGGQDASNLDKVIEVVKKNL